MSRLEQINVMIKDLVCFGIPIDGKIQKFYRYVFLLQVVTEAERSHRDIKEIFTGTVDDQES